MIVDNPLNSSELIFPVLECLHIGSFALAVGTVALVDFRLLNLGMTSQTPAQIAANTKISLRFLKAIEKEEFDKLPGGIFSTSYLRQYAEAIGYDGEALVAHYRLKMNLPAATGKEPPEKVGQKRLDRWLRIPLQTFR